jgi:DNA or RNA helicases of superfamily II
MSQIQLRPKQQLAVERVREAFGQFRRVLLVAPTAFGKTVTFSYIAESATRLGRRVIIVAHRQELIDQISRTLSWFDVDHGIIDPRFSPAYRKPVQVASIGTLLSRLKKSRIPPDYQRFSLMILDEAHHLLATNTFGKVYDMLGQPRMLGVTATPQRGDGKGLGEEAGGLFQTLIEVTDVAELIREGFLSDYSIYAPQEEIDLSGVKVMAGDYEKKSLAERVDRPKVTGNAVREYSRICPGVPTVVFCVSIEHCQHVAAEFQAAGFNFQVIDGSMSAERRKSLIDGLGNGRVTGLVSCDVISEGTDIPAITCAIFLRPTRSLGLFIQQAGRALRTVYADGYDLSTREGRLAAIAASPKPRAILLDHAGLTWVHGLIDDPREWSLEGKKKRKGAKREQQDQRLRFAQCPKCFTIHEVAPVCPGILPDGTPCGHVYETATRKVEQREGDLREITREEREARRRAKSVALRRAETIEEMMAAGASRGEAFYRLKARREKQELVDGLVADLRRWKEETGQSVLETFGVVLSGVPSLKPAKLRELRAKVDDHFAVWRAVAPQQEQAALRF